MKTITVLGLKHKLPDTKTMKGRYVCVGYSKEHNGWVIRAGHKRKGRKDFTSVMRLSNEAMVRLVQLWSQLVITNQPPDKRAK